MNRTLLCFLLLLALVVPALSQTVADRKPSAYTGRPVDPQAIEFAAPEFPVHGDGQGDDAPALQAAIDRMHGTVEQRGVIFIPSGTYRLGRTVNVWRGVRLIGYGAQRPVFLLGEATPGFQGPERRPLFFFAWDRPKEGETIREAGASGFFSAIVNADIEIAAGNPSAIGLRFHVAQHSFLAHMDFRIGHGYAGIEDVGNLIRDCRFFGGEHGIVAHRTAPTWPFVLLDSSFAGQRASSIRTEEAGLTVVRASFRDVPRAIDVNLERPEQLYMRDSRLERIAGPAIMLSDTGNALTQANLQNVIAEDVPVLLALRETGAQVAGRGRRYVVKDLTHGWQSDGVGQEATLRTTSQIEEVAEWPAPPPTDIAVLPAVSAWINAREVGAKGDGVTDDTRALQRALDQHAAVYLPSGKYLVSDTLRLRPGAALFGLHAATTRLVAVDGAAAFAGEGEAVPLLSTARGGGAIVSGLAIDTGVTPRVSGIEWLAGEHSLLEDLCFVSSHSHRGERPAAELPRAWDTQGHSLWVKEGGGGTFLNIWTANTTARSGMFISDTATPGRVYAMSAEHHLHREVRIERAANWSFYALQTEAEGDEGRALLPLELHASRELLFANLFMYRVSRARTPYPEAILVTDSHQVELRGLHLYSPTKFAYDRSVRDATTGREDFARDLARLAVNSVAAEPASPDLRARVRLVASGFENIDGVATLPDGRVCFIEGREGRIHEWSEERGVQLRGESPVRPAMLAIDPLSGALLVISRGGTVFRMAEAAGAAPRFLPLPRVAGDQVPNGTVWLRATSLFGPNDDFVETAGRASAEVWQADSVVLPVAVLPAMARPHPWIMNPAWRAYGLKSAKSGEDFFMADEFRRKTYRFTVQADGRLADARLFAEVGEADIAQAADGRVFIAAGEIFVFNAQGRPLGRIALPQRPTSLAWGGPDGRTLFVGARTSLYAVTCAAE